MNKEFLMMFQLDKTRVFEVDYYTLGDNETSRLSTSACIFNQPKTDYVMCGQAQAELTKNHKIARLFYEKWKYKHLSELTETEYNEMMVDLEVLKQTYNYIIKELDITKKPYRHNISFYEAKELSKMKLSNSRNKPQQCEI